MFESFTRPVAPVRSALARWSRYSLWEGWVGTACLLSLWCHAHGAAEAAVGVAERRNMLIFVSFFKHGGSHVVTAAPALVLSCALWWREVVPRLTGTARLRGVFMVYRTDVRGGSDQWPPNSGNPVESRAPLTSNATRDSHGGGVSYQTSRQRPRDASQPLLMSTLTVGTTTVWPGQPVATVPTSVNQWQQCHGAGCGKSYRSSTLP